MTPKLASLLEQIKEDLEEVQAYLHRGEATKWDARVAVDKARENVDSVEKLLIQEKA